MLQLPWLLAFQETTATVAEDTGQMLQHPGLLAIFAITIVVMLLIDLGVLNRRSHAVSNKEAITWSAIWISLAMIFSGIIYYQVGGDKGLEKFSQFQSCYWIEKALSVDNLFVFILVFNFFNVPREVHHKVLFWGIIGAIVFRAIFIFSGIGIINLTYLPKMELMGKDVQINVVLTLFGAFLIYAGFKSWFVDEDDDDEKDFSTSPGAKIVRRLFTISPEFDGDKFFTIQNGVKLATPLLVVVGVIEFTDLLFARRFHPSNFCDRSQRSIHPLHVEYLCNSWPASLVLLACELYPYVPPVQVWPGNHFGLHRYQDGYLTRVPHKFSDLVGNRWWCIGDLHTRFARTSQACRGRREEGIALVPR